MSSTGYCDYSGYYYQAIVALEARIRQLEGRLAALEEEQSHLKRSVAGIRPVNIEHIHYKVQELNVRELSGSLQLGLTAFTDRQQLEQWLKDAQEDDQPGIAIHAPPPPSSDDNGGVTDG